MLSPVMPPLFLHPAYEHILPLGDSAALRAIWLGVAMSVARFAEFLGSPILGDCSDRMGRRFVVMLSIFGTILGNLLFVAAIHLEFLPLLLVGQFLLGFTGVILVLAGAEVANRCEGHAKTTAIGWIFSATSLGYVFGPLLGGHLADGTLLPIKGYQVAYLGAALISVVNLIFAYLTFPASPCEHTEHPGVRKQLLDIAEILHHKSVRWLLIVNFILYIGIDYVFQFNMVYLVQRWHMVPAQLARVQSSIAAVMVLTQWILVPLLARRWTNAAAVLFAGTVLGGSIAIYIMLSEPVLIWGVLPLIGSSMSLATTNMLALISNAAPREIQGRTLGVEHSTRVLGAAILCLLGGFAAAVSIKLPLAIGAVASIVAVVCLIFYRAPVHHVLPHRAVGKKKVSRV